ncbi:hypothetical protein KVH22_29375 [Streptomyces olivaceus]|uniref:hypothetical protein n=1 Tax=Streptomyces olivaceus TaxID=47716 RepID=UPI001CCDBEB9|nr:hypothetical protein [Streptomyces olivaceus]MBZ6259630.1 hypothetical protein [Streptomyces olivaceus]
MTAGWCLRATRAAVLAAVCVLLAALGHVLMSGAPLPSGALVAAVAATGGAGWSLAGRERGLLPVSSVVVAAQAALHLWFSCAQDLSTPQASPAPPMAHMSHALHAGGPVPGPDPAMSGMSGASAGMLAAHLLAALLTGVWLAYGERAVFRVLRAAAARLAAPLRLLLALPAPAHRPGAAARPGRAARRPRRLLLVYALTSRGPPTGSAAA